MRMAFAIWTVVALGAAAFAEDRGITGTAAAGLGTGPGKYAVIVGINRYGDKGISDLKAAVSDAQAVYELLRSAPGGFDAQRMVLLTDAQGDDRRPTRGIILRYLKSFITLAGPEDTLLIYFAGHGTTLGDRMFLLPSDASLSLIEESGIAYATVEKLMAGSPAKRKVVILDACHSGTGRGMQAIDKSAFTRLERESKGTVVLASCGPEELSHEMEGTGHGAFTYFLMQGLTGEADSNRDGLVGASELSTYTWERTRLWAAQQGLTQTPWRMERVAGDIVLAKSGGSVPAPSKNAPVPQTSTGPQPDSEVAGTSTDGRFTKYANDVIYDSQTDLEWYVGPNEKTDWYQAQTWIVGLTVAGGGWHFPTRKQLLTIYKKGSGGQNRDPIFVSSGWCIWSGETYGSKYAWMLLCKYGYCQAWHRDEGVRTRAFAVRARK